MAENKGHVGPEEPSLELPKLLGRKRRDAPASVAVQDPGAPPRRRRPSRPSVPQLDGRTAAVATGLLVGVLGTLLTYAAMQGCDLVRGTSSCGGGAGLVLLLSTLAAMGVVGAALLALWRVPQPGSSSVVAVGVIAVVALLLEDALFSPWMFLVVPLVGAASYAGAHWLTARHIA